MSGEPYLQVHLPSRAVNGIGMSICGREVRGTARGFRDRRRGNPIGQPGRRRLGGRQPGRSAVRKTVRKMITAHRKGAEKR